MAERWLGVVVSGDKVTIVDAEVPDSGPLVVLADQSWPLQQGDRIPAYVVMASKSQIMRPRMTLIWPL
jgi:hypothetical protein